MKKLFNFIKKNYFVLILVVIAITSHLTWFHPSSILNSSDWTFWPNETTSQLYNSYGTWINFFNFGSVNIQLPFNLFTFIWSLFTNLGLSYDFATKITFLIPIAILGFITPYFLFKRLTKHSLISFIVALFYGTTTYFLVRQTAHIPIAFLYALTPLVINIFIQALKKNTITQWIIFIMVYFISICYEIRIAYIITLILFIYFIIFYFSNIKNYWKNILLSILLFISLNIFWLLPNIFSGLTKNISEMANRGLFGSFLFDLTSAFTLFDTSWTGSFPNNKFIKQPITLYFWLIPIIAISSFIFNKHNKYKKELTFWGIVSILGIFLTKQAGSPFPNAYIWLYKHFPGFNLFREASKFYLLTAIGYAGLLSYGLLILKEYTNIFFNKYFFSFFGTIIIVIAILNSKPLVTGEFKTMFVPRQVPSDYIIFKNYLLKQPEYFRTLWVPTDSKWSFFITKNPKISEINALDAFTKKISKQTNIKLVGFFKQSYANNLLDIGSIKYVVVPLRDTINDDDFFIYYGNNRQLYIDGLNKIKYLKKINIGTKELIIYENLDYRPHIYITYEKETVKKQVTYKFLFFNSINPTEYKIKINNLKKITYLNFSENFHSQWKIKLGKFNWLKAIINKKYFLPDSYHFKNDADLNSYIIDPDYIKKNFSKDYYKLNSDGSIDVELTLYFKPQSYFYLGLIISGLTFSGCIGYLIFDFIQTRKRKTQ